MFSFVTVFLILFLYFYCMSLNQGLTNTTARALSRSWSKRGMTRAEIKDRNRKSIHNT